MANIWSGSIRTSVIISDYFRHIEMELKTEQIRKIVLDNKGWFSYNIRQVEITNILGASVAILNEYFVANSAGESYKLYKTKEGNWYDMPEVNNGVDKNTLLELKLGIDNLISQTF